VWVLRQPRRRLHRRPDRATLINEIMVDDDVIVDDIVIVIVIVVVVVDVDLSICEKCR
jgi:hypothetical protein